MLQPRPPVAPPTSVPFEPREPAGFVPPSGLTSAEVSARLLRDGRNEIASAPMSAWWRILARQFTSLMPAILAAAGVIAVVIGDLIDGIAIGAIAMINGIVGFVQERRAERALIALRAMTAPRAQVIRDGHLQTIAAAELVVGDALVLAPGDIVAADAKLDIANALRIDEAALTGESEPVLKRVQDDPPGTPLAERSGSVFTGTVVGAGTGTATVIATAMRTELGRIAHLLASTEQPATPLQLQLAGVARSLAVMVGTIVAVLAVIAIAHGRPWSEVLLSGVSLAVAAIPEGLAAIVTIALAIGVQRMAARHVLVRRLPAVETLGCATVICADKTGTLTLGAMRVRELWGDDHDALLYAAAACCDAELGSADAAGSGDATELAILVAARERGIERLAIERAAPRVSVIPFDAERKRMAVARTDGKLYVKGAAETVLPLCRGDTESAHARNVELAGRGLRVLAVAIGAGTTERGLRLIGLIAMADPPRQEAIEAIATARRAGIRTVMITGDHPATARAIATELGILDAGEDPSELVHARATPEDKLRIVSQWSARGAVVAMTGDGVNDAPALRAAHIGIAMGKTGTEVTREAASMILTDDNYASIVAAVHEGRTIYANIRKTIVYLLAGNASEVLVMVGAALLGLPLPLVPLQLLWINLVTDGFPALALVVDPPNGDVLASPPRPRGEPMLGRREWKTVLTIGAIEGALTLAAFVWTLAEGDLGRARAVAFSVLVFSEVFRAFAARSIDRVFWEVGAFGNLKLVGVVVVSCVLQLGVLLLPGAQHVFGTSSISFADITFVIGVGLIPVTLLELAKLRRRRSTKRMR